MRSSMAVTSRVTGVPALFHESVAVIVIVYVPGTVYVCEGDAPVLSAVPSPQFHE